MIWLSWRQFRAQAVAACAVIAAVVTVVAITGPRLVDLARANVNVFDLLSRTERDLYYAGVVLIAVVPAIIGAFWGAPLVARELESGTHRLVWNQSVTRSRWLATKLGLTALTSSLAVGALTWAVTWWSDPIDGALSATRGRLPSRLTPVTFAMRGITPVGYTVFALVLGTAVGIVLQRSVPAMALTLALFTCVQIAVPLLVRPHLITPVETTYTFTAATLDSISLTGPDTPVAVSVTTGHAGDWILSNQTFDGAGHATTLPSWFGDCLPAPPSPSSTSTSDQVQAQPLGPCLSRLDAEGYRQRVVYQPADRFWPLQGAETALFLVGSILLAGFCFWWTRTRLS